MLNVLIPKTKYNLTTYPNLDPSVGEETVIPEFWGVKTNINPVCIDTTTLKYKLSKRKLKAIDAIRTEGITRPNSVDYSKDLANGEFTFTFLPYLTASTQYYFVIEGDFAIDGSNYVEVWGDADAGYSGGTAYFINDSDVWSDQSKDLDFVLFGSTTVGGSLSTLIDTPTPTTDWWPGLRDTTARTKLGQSFTMPAGSNYYAREFRFWIRRVGDPIGNLWISIHTNQSGTQSRVISQKIDVSNISATPTPSLVLAWLFKAEEIEGDISVDGQGWYTDSTLMENVADILEDVAINIVGMKSVDLDATAFSALASARTQDLCIYLDEQMKFGQFIEKLEGGSLFKFLPQLDGTHAPIYFASGEPAGTPHLRDEDFISFKCIRNLEGVYQTYRIKYNRNPTTGLYLEKEASSDIAKYIYENENTLEVETYLKDASDASALATSYKSLLEYPQRGIEFEVKSYLLDKIPTNKVKITRARGDNSGGNFNAVLFRVFGLRKNQATGTVTCYAVLDSQTY